MNLRLGTDVQRPDGGKVGELHRVVYDPETAQIVSIVVTHNALDGREIIVPIGVVNWADDEAVELAASEEQFDAFEDFAYEHNIAPPPDAEEVDSDLIDDPVDVPDVLPVGAATGVESIAFTPVLEEHVYVPTGEQVLDRETRIWATDGEVGRLAQLWLNDDTRQVESLLAERGSFRKHARMIPVDVVTRVLPEAITLRVAGSTLQDPYDV